MLERAIGVIGTKQKLEAKQRRKERGHPQRTGRDLAQLSEVGTERQWKQGRDHDEENERLRDLPPVTQCQQQVTAVGQDCGSEYAGAFHQPSSTRRGT